MHVNEVVSWFGRVSDIPHLLARMALHLPILSLSTTLLHAMDGQPAGENLTFSLGSLTEMRIIKYKSWEE